MYRTLLLCYLEYDIIIFILKLINLKKINVFILYNIMLYNMVIQTGHSSNEKCIEMFLKYWQCQY